MPELVINNQYTILLDEPEYNIAKNYKWNVRIDSEKYYFIYTSIKKNKTPFSRIVFNVQKGDIIFHVNGNPLDFKKEQIKIVSRQEYMQMQKRDCNKSSNYKGVFFNVENNKWQVIKVKGKGFFGGRYELEEEAAIAADYLSYKLYKENGYKNFPHLDSEQLELKYQELEQKYGTTPKEKHARNTQGIPSPNIIKTSKYVGVHFNKRKCKWEAEIRYLKKRYWLGLHESEDKAAQAYDKKALELYGESAKLNFLE